MSLITTLRVIHPVGGIRLEEVKVEMRDRGSPEIRVVDFGDYYMAIEGSHRLMAAAELQYAVKLKVLSQSDLVDADSLDLEWLKPGRTYAAGVIAQGLYCRHHPIMTVNSDGTLSLVTKANLEES
jgi:hypothetical protein